MTKEERQTWLHLTHLIKLEYREKSIDKKEKNSLMKKSVMTEDSEILSLLRIGYYEFSKRVAERIVRDNPDVVLLNDCAKCGKRARTPKAKQCRYCGHDWH